MRSFSLVLGIIFLSTAYSDTNEEELQNFNRLLEDKHLVSIKKETGDLSIGGEVRVEYQNKNHQVAVPPDVHGYDVEINLLLDYKADRMWGKIKLEFDNKMGAESGVGNQICLEKAFFGARLLEFPSYTLDAEIGRRTLSDVFFSKVLFSSRFDGALLKFDKEFQTLGDFYVKGAAFLVTSKDIRFAQVFETGLMNIGNSGVGLRYSLSNWRKNPFKSETDPRYEFLISQVTLSQVFSLPFTDKKFTPYIAGVINSAAKETPQASKQLANLGYYLGISMGKIKKQGDWQFDINYQWMGAQTVPGYDSSGVCKGKTNEEFYFTQDTDKEGNKVPHKRQTAVGKGNYRGARMELQYALYENLTVFNSFQYGKTLDNKIGPRMNYNQFEIEMIYSF